MHLVSKSPADTKAIAAKLAHKLVAAMPRTAATIVALTGELGSGKTTFTQGFAAALKVPEMPRSPTFNLAKSYRIPDTNFHLWHLDCYRLTGHHDAITLDLHTIFTDPNNLVLIEWAEQIGDALPREHLQITFAHLPPGHPDTNRNITLPA